MFDKKFSTSSGTIGQLVCHFYINIWERKKYKKNPGNNTYINLFHNKINP